MRAIISLVSIQIAFCIDLNSLERALHYDHTDRSHGLLIDHPMARKQAHHQVNEEKLLSRQDLAERMHAYSHKMNQMIPQNQSHDLLTNHTLEDELVKV